MHKKNFSFVDDLRCTTLIDDAEVVDEGKRYAFVKFEYRLEMNHFA